DGNRQRLAIEVADRDRRAHEPRHTPSSRHRAPEWYSCRKGIRNSDLYLLEVFMQRLRFNAPGVLAIVAVLGQTLWAQSVYEGFNLTFPLFNTGTGLAGSWQPGGFNAFAAGYTAGEPSLAFNGLVTTPGHVSGGAFNAINGAVRNLLQPLGTD